MIVLGPGTKPVEAIVLGGDPVLMAAVFVLTLEPVGAVKLVGNPMLLVPVFEIPVELVEAIGLEDDMI